MEQSKKLKNMFRVTGSETLRKAFREELNNLGFREQGSSNSDYIAVYGGGSGYHYNYDKSCTNHVGTEIYSLPQDWDKALAAAQDYEEVWPKYGKFISPKLKHLTENKIYKLTGEINIGMSDHCYEFINDLGEGDAAHITHFEIVHEEGYLKQEAEPKVGDWVVISYEPHNGYYGRVVQIIPANQGTPSYCFNVDIPHNPEGGFNISKAKVRKATEEEIKKAQEIKVGDMVIALQQVSYLNKGGIAKIYSIGEDLVRFSHTQDNKDFVSSKHIYECFRKATPQEVKNYEEIKVSGYQAEVMNGKIAFGCQHLSKQTLQELNGVACYVDITIGDTKITKGLLTKLINKL